MAEIKVSEMTLLSSVPDDAKIYVVVPGDTTPYYTTKANLLTGISAGFFPDGSSIADWTLMVELGEFWFYRNDGSGLQEKFRIETDGISFFDDAGNFKYWIKKPASGTSILVAPETTGDETIATKEWVSIITNEKADLVGGVIPSSQLPSYVDDVIEGYKSGSSFYRYPDFTSVISPDTGKIYVDLVAGQKYKQYRWTSGAGYVQISNGFIASTDDVPEAANLYFTLARVLATQLTGLPTLSGDVIEEDSILNAIAKLKSSLSEKLDKNKSSNIAESTTDGTASSGTSNTVTMTLPIPANTFGANQMVDVIGLVRASGTAGTRAVRLYINTSADLSGSPILIGANTGIASSNLEFPLQRFLRIKVANGTGAGTEVMSTSLAQASNYGLSANASTTCAIDWTVAQYLVMTVQATNTNDSLRGTGLKARR